MIADTPEELHTMADRIGLARRWFQAPPAHKTPHYDVCKSKRALAIRHGAVEVKSARELVEIQRRIRRQ
jgi:hypothetical protein